MPTITELKRTIEHISTVVIPELQQAVAQATVQREQAETTLKSLGWDGEQDPGEFVEELKRKRDEALARLEAAVKEAEDAIRGVNAAVEDS